jgi:hypothetical protein
VEKVMKSIMIRQKTVGIFLAALLLLINYSQSPLMRGEEVVGQEFQGTIKRTPTVVAMSPAKKAVVRERKVETPGKGFMGRHLRFFPTPAPVDPTTASPEETLVQPIIEWQW